jgi:hypothetical protein
VIEVVESNRVEVNPDRRDTELLAKQAVVGELVEVQIGPAIALVDAHLQRLIGADADWKRDFWEGQVVVGIDDQLPDPGSRGGQGIDENDCCVGQLLRREFADVNTKGVDDHGAGC